MSTVTERIEELEDQLHRANVQIAVLSTTLQQLEATISDSGVKQLKERLAVLEDKVSRLEANKLESEKRLWQFAFILVGATCAVIGGIVVAFVKKP